MEFIKTFINNFSQQTAISLIEAIIIIAVLDIFSPLFSYIIVKAFNWKKKGEEIKENAFYTPIKAFFRLSGIYLAILFLKPVLGINEGVMNIVTKIYRMLIIISTAIGLANSITTKSKFINIIKQRADKEVDDSSTNIIVKVIKVVIYVIAGFMVISDLGYDLSGLITGLGLGSVVVTIAAQDTIKNLFGGLIIAFDKPFKVGEYIKFSTYEGTVEDMTFRSTKLRTSENTIIQIPNSEISSSAITNYSMMQKRRYGLNLGLVLNTDLNKMVDLKTKILEFLNTHSNIIPDSANVFFQEIESSSFKLSIFCYTDITNYIEYLNIKEQLNYGIMNIVNQNNIELAYDTQTVEIKKYNT